MRKRKIVATFLAVVISAVLLTTPVLAAYSGLIQIITGATAYSDPLPAIADMDNTLMVAESIIDTDGRDVRVERSGAAIPRMLADDKTLFASTLNANSTTNFYYTTDNTPEVFDVLTGYEGNITITDDDTLELGSDFEIEQSGYVDTTGGADVNLVYKEDAFRTYIDGANAISSTIDWGAPFPVVEAENGGNDVVNQVNHTVNLPAGIVAGELLLVIFGSDGGEAIGWPGGWTELFEKQDGGNSTLAVGYRVADGGEGANITVTTGNIQMTAHSTYRISGYEGVPEAGTAVTGVNINPNPPNLTPSWGARNTLWFPMCGYINGTVTVAAYPANYVDGQRNDRSNHVNGCGLGTAHREVNAVSEDPGTFTLSIAANWVTNTVAIAPADLTVTATSIASGEYTVKTYGVAHEPAWATGDVLYFTGAADSNVNAGVIHNAIAKMWVSLWFKLDTAWAAGGGTSYIWGKVAGGADYIYVWLHNNGNIYYQTDDGGGAQVLSTVATSWDVGWHHIICSVSNVAGKRLIVDGVVATGVTSTVPNGGDFCIGDVDDPGAGNGFIGEIQNVIVGTGDLSTDEEADLYAGIAPTGANAPTNYWYIDEGTGTGVDAVIDYGSAPSHGDVDAACTWETATYTTGSTGRRCDFYIEVDDGVADPDRWGANLKGASVPPNGNDWRLNQNNVMPWMDYYYHTVGGVLHAWYQPNYIVEVTDHDGVEDVGGSDTTITDATMTEAPGHWVDALVTITASAGAALGESRVCTVFAAGGVITVAPAFSANIAFDDEFTIDFGTLIDRSYYNLHFDGTATSNVNAGAIHDDIPKLWISFWFNLDNGFDIGDTAFQMLCGKWLGPNDKIRIYLDHVTGLLRADQYLGGLTFDLTSTTDTWVANTWYYVLISLTDTFGGTQRLLINGTLEDSDTQATANTPNGGDFVIGDFDDPGSNAGLIGEIQNVIVGTDDLTTDEEDDLYAGTAPGDETNYWYIDEGSSTNIVDYGSDGDDGTRDTNTAWQTSTDTYGVAPYPHNAPGTSGTNDSRITWGVNPADISYTIGSLVSTDVTIVTVTAPTPQDVLPVTPDIELFGMSAPVNMFSPWFDTFANVINLPSVILWVTFAMLLIVGVAVLIFFVTKSVFASTMIAAFLMAGCSVSGFLPVWTLILALVIAVFSLAQRKVI